VETSLLCCAILQHVALLLVVVIAVQWIAVPVKPWDRLEYSFMSLENSEFLFSSNFDGVSYSMVFPAKKKNACVILLKLDLVILVLFVHSVAYLR
jgi:hypothetical protein